MSVGKHRYCRICLGLVVDSNSLFYLLSCGICNIDWRIFEKFGDEFVFFPYVGESCPFSSWFVFSAVLMFFKACLLSQCRIYYCLLCVCVLFIFFIGFVEAVCVHSIDHVTYGSMFMFVWVARIWRCDRIVCSRFSVYLEDELVFFFYIVRSRKLILSSDSFSM
jgi:hypothetical protein